MTQRSAFWLARFDSEEDLIHYIEYHYDAAGNAHCPFAADLGHRYDPDFLECVYTDPEELAAEVGDFSHAEHFGEALEERLRAVEGDWNTILMLTGAKEDYNGFLFYQDLHEQPAADVRLLGVFTYEPKEDKSGYN